jgi:hypothetical protein
MYFVIQILYGNLPSIQMDDRVMSSITSYFLTIMHGSEDPFRWSIVKLPMYLKLHYFAYNFYAIVWIFIYFFLNNRYIHVFLEDVFHFFVKDLLGLQEDVLDAIALKLFHIPGV